LRGHEVSVTEVSPECGSTLAEFAAELGFVSWNQYYQMLKYNPDVIKAAIAAL